MSKELADRFERDMSAPEETRERARRARERGAALGVDWEEVLALYRARANRGPKRFVRFPEADFDSFESTTVEDERRDSVSQQ